MHIWNIFSCYLESLRMSLSFRTPSKNSKTYAFQVSNDQLIQTISTRASTSNCAFRTCRTRQCCSCRKSNILIYIYIYNNMTICVCYVCDCICMMQLRSVEYGHSWLMNWRCQNNQLFTAFQLVFCWPDWPHTKLIQKPAGLDLVPRF